MTKPWNALYPIFGIMIIGAPIVLVGMIFGKIDFRHFLFVAAAYVLGHWAGWTQRDRVRN